VERPLVSLQRASSVESIEVIFPRVASFDRTLIVVSVTYPLFITFISLRIYYLSSHSLFRSRARLNFKLDSKDKRLMAIPRREEKRAIPQVIPRGSAIPDDLPDQWQRCDRPCRLCSGRATKRDRILDRIAVTIPGDILLGVTRA